MSRIPGRPSTVVKALLEVVSNRGKLVVPTFRFTYEAEEDPIIDPYNDPSEMGIATQNLSAPRWILGKKPPKKCLRILVTPNQRD
jgi:aminoglycoside N3'-acetyltransferase